MFATLVVTLWTVLMLFVQGAQGIPQCDIPTALMYVDSATLGQVHLVLNMQDIVIYEQESAAYPTWSPDGSTIAYSYQGTLVSEIRLMDIDGSNHRTIATIEDAFLSFLNWSPDGRYLAFTASYGINEIRSLGYDIYLVDMQTGEVANLTYFFNSVSISDLLWTPDGYELFFVSSMDGMVDIHSVVPTKGTHHQYTQNETVEHLHGWDVNGFLLYSEDRPQYEAIFWINSMLVIYTQRVETTDEIHISDFKATPDRFNTVLFGRMPVVSDNTRYLAYLTEGEDSRYLQVFDRFTRTDCLIAENALYYSWQPQN